MKDKKYGININNVKILKNKYLIKKFNKYNSIHLYIL